MPPTISAEEAQDVPRQNLMLIVTGSQGERRAASAQLARGSYLGFTLKDEDMFLFSSITIPGNERGVLQIVNALSEKGVDVVDNTQGAYHVSGHANRPDLERMHQLIRPRILIPMHGEHRHLRQHARVAAANGLQSIVAVNGMMLELSGEAPSVVEHVDTGRLYLDGTAIYGSMDGVVRDRIRMALNGLVVVTLVIEEDGSPLGDPWADCMGLAPEGRNGQDLAEAIEEDLADELPRAPRKTLSNDDKLTDMIKRRVRSVCVDQIGKKPEVVVVISRLSDG
jgi:ribonuclease J